MLSVAARAVSEVVLIVAQVLARAPYMQPLSLARFWDVSSLRTVGAPPMAIRKHAAYRASPLLLARKIAYPGSDNTFSSALSFRMIC